jgi:hypothetical protein
MIKNHLINEDHLDEEKHLDKNDVDWHDYVFSGRNKWDLIKSTDKKKFFSLWYVAFLVSNFLQIISGIFYVIFPILDSLNQFFCGLSCFLTWVSCGYFFESEHDYAHFYLTVKKSLKAYSKFFLVFLTFFIGFSILSKYKL